MKTSKAKYCFFDLETTGFDPIRHSILTISMYVTDDKYNLLGEYHGKSLPTLKEETFIFAGKEIELWSKDAENVHRIHLKDAKKHESEIQLCRDIYSFLIHFNSRLTLVYHANTPFDIRFLFSHFFCHSEKAYYLIQKYISWNRFDNTMAMAREYINKGKDIFKQIEKNEKTIAKMNDYLTKERKTPVKADKLKEWNDLKEQAENELKNLSVNHIQFEGVSLDKICKALGLKLDHHDASSDAKVLIDIHKFFSLS